MSLVQVTIFFSGKAVTVTYYEYMSVALCVQHAIRMRLILLSFVDCLPSHIFEHYLINCMIFGKRLLNVCFDFL